MTELFIEDQPMELSEGTVIAITRQVNDIADLQNREFDRTNSFTIPRSPGNDLVFENADLVVSDTLRPFRKLNARLRIDGYDEIRNGVGILDGITDRGYKLVIYSGLLDFFDVIGKKTLQDLDLSAFDHVFNLTTVADSQTNTTGFIYAVADYGNLPFTTRVIPIQQQGPSFFVRTIIDQIFTDAGFTKSGTIFSDQQYLDLLIPFVAEEIPASNRALFIAESDGTQSPFSTYPTTLNFENEIVDPDNTFIDPNWTAPQAFASIRFIADVELEVSSASVTAELFSSIAGILDSVVVSSGSPQSAQLDSGNISVASGEVITVRVDSVSTPTTTPGEGSLFSNAITGGFGVDIDMALAMPKMKQVELIKAVANIFGLVITFDVDSPLDVGFKEFQDLYDTNDEVDWSNKLDLGRSIDIEFGEDSYAQNNHLVWIEDPGNLEENLGRGTFTIDDLTLERDKDVIKIPFAASSPTIKLQGAVTSVITRYTDPESSGAWPITESVKPRLCINRTVNKGAGAQFTFDDGGGTSLKDNISVPRFFDDDDLDELNGNTLLTEHYAGLTSSLARFKRVEAFFFLEAEDVYNLDHFVPVYVEFFGAKFFVIRVSNFIAGVPVKVELMKL